MIAVTDAPPIAFSPRRGFLNVGIALLVFILACAGLNALLPFPEIDVVSAELRFYEKHKDEFDTLFVGSSHIHHQISPALFDRIMREGGHPTHTFNLGINGMFPPESGFVLERLLRSKPRHLKWVILELDELETRRFPQAEASRRALYWHDWRRTALVLQQIFETAPGSKTWDARDRFFFHTALFAKNFANIGRKIDLSWWSSHLVKESAPPRELGPDNDGFVPQNRTLTAEETFAYETGLKEAVARTESRFVSAATEKAYRQWAEEVKRSGATPIFLVTPKTTQIKLGFRPESGIDAAILRFNDAGAYPQLYRQEARFDTDHLNGTGAEEFTKLVAHHLSQLMEKNRVP